MGRDNHPRERQAKQLARKRARRNTLDRILIVCEGSKTEPQYFKEIRQFYRLGNTSVVVKHSQAGTSPKLVVEYAFDLFQNGDPHNHIQPQAFEQVYAVFDRDEHQSYHDALKIAEELDRKLRNDEKQLVTFKAIPSVPNFELWLLLHFDDISHRIHRDEVIERLRKCLVGYSKGQKGLFSKTQISLNTALCRADHLRSIHTAHNGEDPYTDVGTLVKLLTNLKTEN